MTNSNWKNIEPAEEKLKELITEVIEHGFGEFTVETAILKRGRREVIFTAGKKFRYVVEKNDEKGKGGAPMLDDQG